MQSLSRARELRRKATPAEKVVWEHLRNRQLAGYKFRRQYPVGLYFIDFICLSEKLIVELDGAHHEKPGQLAYDQVRSEFLEAGGYKILRFQNHEVSTDLSGVLETIMLALKAPRPQGEGLG